MEQTASANDHPTPKIKLNLGCGDKHLAGYDNIDIDPAVKPDILRNIANAGLEEYPDNYAHEIVAYDFLEHIPIGKTIYVIDEIWRVLKPDGLFEHKTPSTDGRGAFQDPMHVSFWNINSWYYYCPELVGGKRFYGIKAKFKVHKLHDEQTDTNVIHTYGLMGAIKP